MQLETIRPNQDTDSFLFWYWRLASLFHIILTNKIPLFFLSFFFLKAYTLVLCVHYNQITAYFLQATVCPHLALLAVPRHRLRHVSLHLQLEQLHGHCC